MTDDRIRIITTGGTFDKLYDAIKGELTFRESQLPRILQQARVTLPVHLDSLLAGGRIAQCAGCIPGQGARSIVPSGKGNQADRHLFLALQV